jgi:hypothetical protein
MQMDSNLVGSSRFQPTLQKGRVRKSFRDAPVSDRWFPAFHYRHECTLRGVPANWRANLTLIGDLYWAPRPRRRKYKGAIRALNRSVGELAS